MIEDSICGGGQTRMIQLLRGRSARRHSVSRFYLCVSLFICGSFSLLSAPRAAAQDWFRTGTGLGVSKARVAVADFSPKSPTSQPLAAEFSDVVRSDLDYSGILELVSKSMKIGIASCR